MRAPRTRDRRRPRSSPAEETWSSTSSVRSPHPASTTPTSTTTASCARSRTGSASRATSPTRLPRARSAGSGRRSGLAGSPARDRRRGTIWLRAARTRLACLVNLDVPVREDALVPLDHGAPGRRPPLGPHDPGDVRPARLAAIDEDGLEVAALAVSAEALLRGDHDLRVALRGLERVERVEAAALELRRRRVPDVREVPAVIGVRHERQRGAPLRLAPSGHLARPGEGDPADEQRRAERRRDR